MSLLTRTDQKFLSFALSSLWKFMPGLAGLSCKSNAVVLTAFCSSPVRRARLSVKVSAIRNSITSYPEDLHHLVAQVIDHLHGDAALRWFVERARDVAVQSPPGFRVDFRFQRRFQRAVGVVCTEKVGLADKEAFFVVVGVDQP